MIAVGVAVVYMCLTVFAIGVLWKKHNVSKNYLSSAISGLVLLGYSVYLYLAHRVVGHEFVVVLAVVLLQMASYQAGKDLGKVNVVHQLIRLALHIGIAVGLIFF